MDEKFKVILSAMTGDPQIVPVGHGRKLVDGFVWEPSAIVHCPVSYRIDLKTALESCTKLCEMMNADDSFYPMYPPKDFA